MSLHEILQAAQAAAQIGFSFVVCWWLLTRHDKLLSTLLEFEHREKEALERILSVLERRN